MPTDAERPDSGDPSHRVLFDELKLARQYGLKNPSKPLPGLLYVARILSAEPEDADKIKDAIIKGITRLGGQESEALMTLMGFADNTQDLSVTERREAAAKLAGHASREVFRTKTEDALLRSVATLLSVLVAEQRMADERSAAERTYRHEAPLSIEAEHEHQTPSVSRPGYLSWRHTASAVLTALVVAGVAVLIAALATRQHHGASVGSCGSTTAQLFDATSSQAPSAIYGFAPHQEGANEGWTDSFFDPADEPKEKETFRYGESRLLALSYINTSATTEQNIIARVGLPPKAAVQANSACLYKHGDYSSGTRYGVSPLVSQAGLKIGNVGPGESVYLTFEEQLPATTPYINLVKLYGRIGPEDEVAEPEWTREQGYLELELTK
jgi:hypothetical protein